MNIADDLRAIIVEAISDLKVIEADLTTVVMGEMTEKQIGWHLGHSVRLAENSINDLEQYLKNDSPDV